jgi:hypothetical protein
MTDLVQLSIGQASELICQRSISSAEVVEANLQRLGETEPVIQAYAGISPKMRGARPVTWTVSSRPDDGAGHSMRLEQQQPLPTTDRGSSRRGAVVLRQRR